LHLFLMRTQPLGGRYGWRRGNPIDRRYIEDFLAANRGLIRGRCLEVGGAQYIERFGSATVKTIDVLDIDSSNRRATIIGDLQDLATVCDGSYDCVIVTQVMQYLQDPIAGSRELHRILAPGGSVLVSVPTMAPCDAKDLDRWRFMPLGIRDLFVSNFGLDGVTVRSYGNLLTGLAYWAGLAQEDLPHKAWGFDDPFYPVIVTVRATRESGPLS
jgi:SAM-dependent methyltransferase